MGAGFHVTSLLPFWVEPFHVWLMYSSDSGPRLLILSRLGVGMGRKTKDVQEGRGEDGLSEAAHAGCYLPSLSPSALSSGLPHEAYQP